MLQSRLIRAVIILLIIFSFGCQRSNDDVDTEPPVITYQSPADSETDVYTNTQITVTFNKRVINISGESFFVERIGSFGAVPAAVTYDDTTFTALITPNENLDWDTLYVVTITSDVRSRAGVAISPVSWVFTTGQEADTIPPAIAGKSPSQNYYIPVDTDIYVTFSEAVIPATVNSSSFFIKNNDTDTVVPATVDYNADLFTATLTIASGSLEEWTNYTVHVLDTITDTAGNNLQLTQWSFKTDDVNKPEVTDRTPGVDATNVPRNAIITAVFSESLNSSTIHNNTVNFQLQKETTPGNFATVAASVIYNNTTKTATLYPSSIMDEDTEYRVILSENITDLAYNTLDNAPVQWEFTTSNAADTTPPEVDSTDPADTDTGIETDADITVVFKENVTGATGSTNFIIETVSDSTQVPGNIIYNSSTRTATFTPVNLLSEGTWYRIRLTSGIVDGSSNALVPVSFTFETADNTKPTVVSRFPLPNAGNTAANININAVFSENVINADALNFTVHNETAGIDVTGDVAYSAATKTAVFDPDGDSLAYSSEFTVTLSNTIEDTHGNTLNLTSWTFITGSEPDTTPPAVIAPTYPDFASHENNIPVSSSVSIYFSEAVMGVGAANIQLKEGDINGILIPAMVTFDSVSNKATLLPSNYLKSSTDYTVIVDGGTSTEIKDMAGNKVAADITWSFTTIADTTAPAVVHRTPEQGTPDIPGNAVRVNVIFSERVQYVDASSFKLIRVSNSAEVPSNVTYDYDPVTNTASAELIPQSDIPESETGTYRVRLTSDIKDISVNQNALGVTEWTFEIIGLDETAPDDVSRTPDSGETNWISGTISVIFSEDVQGVSASSFYLRDSSNNTVPAVVTYSKGLLTAYLQITGSVEYEETYTAYLTDAIRDRADNQFIAYSWSFSSPADIVPPSVTSVYPPDNTSAFPVSGQISATFSEGIAGYNNSTFYLIPAPAVAPDIIYDPDTKILTMIPASNLSGSTDYTVHITTGITDQATIPNSLAAEYSWDFTTQDVPDVIDPWIVDGTRSPGPGASGIALTTTVSLQFSENVTNATTKVTLRKSGEIVPTDPDYNSSSFTITLTPREQLESNTVYTVRVMGGPTGIQDTSGRYLAVTDEWTFTTVTDTTPPYVLLASRYPDPGSSGVPLKPVVTATFSEPVTGVDSSSFYLTGTGVPTCYVIYDEATRTATLTPGSNLANGTLYTVRLATAANTIEDRTGNDLATTTWTFTTNSLPVITEIAYSTGGAYTPAADSATIPYNVTNIRITFNRSMNTAKQWAEIYELATGNAPSPATPGQWTWTGDTVVTYSITGRFKGGTAYQFRLYGWGGTFEDPDGNTVSATAYVGNGIFDFTTAADSTAPAIASSIPANGATNVGRDIGRYDTSVTTRTIIIRFNEMMNQTRDSRITLSPAVTTTRSGWIEGGRTVIFTFTSSLTASTAYTVTLNGGMNSFRDIAGNDASGSFSFTTGTATGYNRIHTDSFDNYSYPDYDIFENITGDDSDWEPLTIQEAGNGSNLTPQNGAYFAQGASWLDGFGDHSDMEYISPADFSVTGAYILTFQTPHERLYNRPDRLQIWLSTNGTDFTQITAGAMTDILRYDWSFANDAPAWHTHYVDLSQYSGTGYGNVWLRFRAISAGDTGGNVIIDNLILTRY